MIDKVATGSRPGIGPGMVGGGNIFDKRLLLHGVLWQRVGAFFALGSLLLLTALLAGRGSSPLLPVFLVVALLIATAAILRPGFAVWLIFVGAALPSLVVRLSFHTLHLVEPTLGLCLLIVFLRRPAMRLRLPHILALLFLGIAVISFIHVPNISTTLNENGADKVLYLLVLYILAFFIGTFLVEYIKDISSFLVAILLCNIPLYLASLAQALGLHMFSFLVGDVQSAAGRLVSSSSGPATFGLYLVNVLAIALVCWLLGARRRDRVIGVVMTVATILEIIGTGTRSAAVASLVMVIFALVVTRRYKLMFGTFVLSGIAFVLLLGKILPRFLHSDNSALSRLLVWQQGLHLIQLHPWLGIGLEQFPAYYAQFIVPRAQQLDPTGISVHNQYLDWALSSGVIWLLVAIALLLSILFYCVKAYRDAQQQQRAILLAAALAVVATLMVSFVDVPLVKTEGGVFFFLLAGLALGQARRTRGGNPLAHMATARVSGVRAGSPTGLVNSLYIPTPTRQRGYRTLPPSTMQPAAHEVETEEETPSAQKAGRSVVLQVLSWGISAAIIFPATALLTRYLGPVRYGEYSFTIPFLSIFALLSGTGMDPIITRTLSTQKRAMWSETLSFAAGTRLLSTLVMSGFGAFIALVLPVSSEQRVLLLLGSGSLLFSFSFNGLRTVYECGFWAEQRFAIPSLIEALDRVVTSGLIVVAILLRLSLAWTYILIVYSDLPFTLALVVLSRRRFQMRLRFSLARIREYLLGSLSLTVHNALSLFANQANVLLLLPLAGSLSVGFYGLALRITTPLQTIAVMYVIGLYPLLCKEFVEGRKRFSLVYSETARILALAVFPLAIFVSMEADDIVLLLGGNRFVAASSATQILVWAVIVTFFSQLAIRGCMAAKLERSIPYVTGSVVVVNVIANLLLIPHFQATGAAFASLFSQLVAFLLFTVLLARHMNLLHAAAAVLRVALGNLPGLVFLLCLPHIPWFLRLLVFVALVIAGCILTRAFSLKDIMLARDMLFTRATTSSMEIDTSGEFPVVVPKIDKTINLQNH